MFIDYKEHECTVCGKHFRKDIVYAPRCPECYAKKYIKKCAKCKKLMTETECKGGNYNYCQKCFNSIIIRK